MNGLWHVVRIDRDGTSQRLGPGHPTEAEAFRALADLWRLDEYDAEYTVEHRDSELGAYLLPRQS